MLYNYQLVQGERSSVCNYVLTFIILGLEERECITKEGTARIEVRLLIVA